MFIGLFSKVVIVNSSDTNLIEFIPDSRFSKVVIVNSSDTNENLLIYYS